MRNSKFVLFGLILCSMSFNSLLVVIFLPYIIMKVLFLDDWAF